jgi:hypothetical protein
MPTARRGAWEIAFQQRQTSTGRRYFRMQPGLSKNEGQTSRGMFRVRSATTHGIRTVRNQRLRTLRESLGVGATSLGQGALRANRERWTRHSPFLPIAASHHPVNLPFRNAAVGKGRHSTDALPQDVLNVSTASSRKKCPDRGGFFALRHSYL